MAYGNFKDLLRKKASDKVLQDKAFHTAKYDGYQSGLTSVVYNKGTGIHSNVVSDNQQLAKELRRSINRKLE